jgi:VanZ family protein
MISLLEKNRWLAVLFTILIAIEIFYFSTLPGSTGTETTFSFAKIYHFTVFFLFAFFLFMSIKGSKKIKVSYIIITLTASILYAITDEIHQIFVPLRHASIGDILTNSLGICFAIIIGLIVNKKRIARQD